jgi:hypothetical protein
MRQYMGSKKGALRRKKYQYTRNEFIIAVCNKCRLCHDTKDPVLCYDYVYKDYPKRFMKAVLQHLIEANKWITNTGYKNIALCPDEDIKYIFKTVFCNSKCCEYFDVGNQPCKSMAGCVFTFRKQFKYLDKSFKDLDKASNVLDYSELKKKYDKVNYNIVRNRNKKYVKPEPYPTFFCNKRFEKEIEKILYGDDNREQDKVEEYT